MHKSNANKLMRFVTFRQNLMKYNNISETFHALSKWLLFESKQKLGLFFAFLCFMSFFWLLINLMCCVQRYNNWCKQALHQSHTLFTSSPVLDKDNGLHSEEVGMLFHRKEAQISKNFRTWFTFKNESHMPKLCKLILTVYSIYKANRLRNR